MINSISDLRVEAQTRIPVTVATKSGHILSTGSKSIQSYSASINEDLAILDRASSFPDLPKHHLFIVIFFADQKFAFTSYRGNPNTFVAAPKHQRGYEVFDGQEYRNSFHDKNVGERIRRSHWTRTHSGQPHIERPVMVTIIPFEKASDRDVYAAKFIADIDLSNNLHCLNHRSYAWGKPETKAPANDNASNAERRKTADEDRKADILRRAGDDATIHKILNIGSMVVSKGTCAELATKNRIPLNDLNDIIAGNIRRGWTLHSKDAEREARTTRNNYLALKAKRK